MPLDVFEFSATLGTHFSSRPCSPRRHGLEEGAFFNCLSGVEHGSTETSSAVAGKLTKRLRRPPALHRLSNTGLFASATRSSACSRFTTRFSVKVALGLRIDPSKEWLRPRRRAVAVPTSFRFGRRSTCVRLKSDQIRTPLAPLANSFLCRLPLRRSTS